VTARAGFWEIVAVGVAVGGTGVWALAAAARIGLLRLLLEAFPRPAWDAVTWGLIPVLLLVPCLLQGGVLAWLSGQRPAPIGRGVAGSAVGTVAAMGVLGTVLLDGVRRLPARTLAVLAKTAPDALIVLFALAIASGWLLLAARAARRARAGRIAALAAAVALAIFWQRNHGQIVALSYVLDRPEANGFFASVAVGGALGSAWAIRRTHGEAA
jgi:hypothetical protein